MDSALSEFVIRSWLLARNGEISLLSFEYYKPCLLVGGDNFRMFWSRFDLMIYLLRNPPKLSIVPPKIEKIVPVVINLEHYLQVELREMDGQNSSRQRYLHLKRDSGRFKICCDVEDYAACGLN